MQDRLAEAGVAAEKQSISVRTARQWLKGLDCQFSLGKNGMYVNGDEREDVVEY